MGVSVKGKATDAKLSLYFREAAAEVTSNAADLFVASVKMAAVSELTPSPVTDVRRHCYVGGSSAF